MTKRVIIYVAIYTRVSTDEQAERGFSLQTQEEASRQYAEQRGWQVTAVFREEGVTGKILDRPRLDELRDLIETGEIGAVICYDQDRLARNAAHYLLLREEFERHGVELHFVQTGHAETDEDRLMETIRAGIAEYERAKIIERSRRNTRARVRAGSTIVYSRPPYGYKVECDGSGIYHLVFDEEEARIVRQIYAWYIEGEPNNAPLSMLAITTRLTGMGVPSPADVKTYIAKKSGKGVWSPATVCRILTTETYVGVWHYGKFGRQRKRNDREQWDQVQVPAIVDRETWNAAQERRAKNREHAWRRTEYAYLMRCRLTCGVCGYKLTGGSKQKGKYLYYRCPGRQAALADRFRHCSLPYVPAGLVDMTVWSWVKSLLTDSENLVHNLDEQREEREKVLRPLRERLAIVTDLLSDHRQQLQRLLDLYLQGDFPREMLIERKTRLEETIAQLEKENADLRVHLERQSLTEEQMRSIESLSARVREAVQKADEDFELKRQLVELLDVQGKLVVEDGKQIVYVRCVIDEACLPIESRTAVARPRKLY